MTIDFFYAMIQQQDERSWHIVADFAAGINGFSCRDYASLTDFQSRLRQLHEVVETMMIAAERLK